MSTVEAFVRRHRDWVSQKLAVRPARPERESFPPTDISLLALGESYRVHLAGGRGRLRAEIRGGVLSLRGAWDGATPAAARRALLSWLMEHARAAIEERLRAAALRGDFRYRSLQLRRQRTRWGSCSSRGVISLNVCAVFQDSAVLDYLLVHELVHTRHMNHSAAYWSAVAEHCPDWRRLDRELSQGWKRVPSWVFA
jgi:predicted metal-dependent hydrolase